MNGDDFYEKFKDALRFFELSWGEKEKLIVTATADKIWFSYDRSSIVIDVKENAENK